MLEGGPHHEEGRVGGLHLQAREGVLAVELADLVAGLPHQEMQQIALL